MSSTLKDLIEFVQVEVELFQVIIYVLGFVHPSKLCRSQGVITEFFQIINTYHNCCSNFLFGGRPPSVNAFQISIHGSNETLEKNYKKDAGIVVSCSSPSIELFS